MNLSATDIENESEARSTRVFIYKMLTNSASQKEKSLRVEDGISTRMPPLPVG